jgi:hypothetical protein
MVVGIQRRAGQGIELGRGLVPGIAEQLELVAVD